MEKWMKMGMYVGAALLVLAMFGLECAYDFFYTEQGRVFLFSEAYAREVLAQPGGVLEYVASFLIQFYVYDWVGPMVTAGLFLLIVLLTDRWLDRAGLTFLAPLASVLTAGMFIILELDMEFRTEGTLAVVACLAVMNLYARAPSVKLRLGALAVCVPALYWMMGPAVWVLAVCVCLWETGNRHYGAWLLVLWSVLPAVLWWYGGNGGEARTVFLPDAYYNPHLVPKQKLYYPWELLLMATAVGSLFRLTGLSVSFKRWTSVVYGLEVVVAMACCHHLYRLAHGEYSYQMKRLEVYRIRGEWDKVLAEPLRSDRNELHACYQNLAMAQKGVLADSLFHYPQCPPNGLVVNWNGSRQQSDLLSDVFWLQGNVALSQKMAFDGMYFNKYFMNFRLMLRLIETNLVLGEYGVAEKYIRLCEQSHYYADKAREYRKYLPGADGQELDGVLAVMRQCLPKQEEAILSNFYKDAQHVLSGCPDYLPALHYLGCKLLLDNNLEMFKYFFEHVYPTDASPSLPLHFQEALLLIYDEGQCREYGVTDAVIARYKEFRRMIEGSKTRENAAAIYRAGFNHTFWVHSFVYQKNH